MEDEDLLSVSMIPDTPSPVFGKKPRTLGPGEDLLKTDDKLQSDVSSTSDLIGHKQTPEDSTSSRSGVKCLFGASNGLALPGSPEFARQRQEAVRKKLALKQTSPFKKSKYTLSPIKLVPTSYKLNNMSPPNSSGLNSQYMQEKMKPSTSTCTKQDPKYAGFVKSSSLLRESPSAAKLKHNSKRKRVETVTYNSAIDKRTRKKAHNGAIGWPSSSSESSDDEITPPLRVRLGKDQKSNNNNDTLGFKDSRPSISFTEFTPPNNKKKEDGSNTSKLKRSKPIVNLDDNYETGLSSCMLASSTCTASKSRPQYDISTSSAHNLNRNSTKCDNSAHNMAARSKNVDSQSKSSGTSSAICKKDKKIKKSKPCDNSGAMNNKCPISPPRSQTDMDSSPYRCRTSSTVLPLYERRHISPPIRLTPTSTELFHRLNDSIDYDSPGLALQPDPLTPLYRMNSRFSFDDVVTSAGSSSNPIDLTSMTPETQKAMTAINQVENDEDIARKLQEELDREYAMSLQDHNTSVPGIPPNGLQTGLGNVDTGALNVGEPSTTSPQHYHMYSPVRQAPAQRRRGGAGSRQGRHPGLDSLDVPDDHLLHLLQWAGTNTLEDNLYQTRAMLVAMGQPGVELNHLWDRVPSRRGGRRRGGRGRRGAAGAMFGLYSPGANGEDYEDLMNLAEMLGDVKSRGLSRTESARLPVVSYNKTEGQEAEECNICMTDYEHGDSQKILPCFHSFHSTCIDKWIGKNATCPICRVEVKIG